MDGPVDWWWKMSLLDVCVQAGFCQIRSQLFIYLYMRLLFFIYGYVIIIGRYIRIDNGI